ncbi:MAG: LysR family transcriptional regulator [Vulcanimicrobiaceae bacterium]
MLNLTLGRLRAFLEVARCESISQAAERLVVSQPAVSSAIAQLQRDVGAGLVERDGRRIRLTPAGRILERYARRCIALLEDGVAEAHAASGLVKSRVRVAAVTTVAEHVLPAPLHDLQLAYPELHVELDVGNRGQVWERLAHWESQVVVAGRPPADEAFRTLATRLNEVIVVARRQSNIAADQLSKATWLLREPGSGTRAMTQEFFEQLGIDPAAQLTIGSNGAIRECVRAGLGISLVSRDAVRRDLEVGSLVEIRTALTPLVRHWHIVVHAEQQLPDSVRRFCDYLIENAEFTIPTPST